MSHINRDTLDGLKMQHNQIHRLLKRYYEDQDVTEQELIDCLESLKSDFANDIDTWKSYLGYE